MAAVGTAFPKPLPGGSALLYTGVGTLHGWSFRETAGSAAVWRLRDGTTVAGEILAVGQIPTGLSDASFADVHFEVGIFFEAVSGTVEGVVWLD